MWYNIWNKQKHKNSFWHPHPMLFLNPHPWKEQRHISRTLSLFAGGSIDAENISILYLDLSKDITTEKKELLFWTYRNKYNIL
jgi:hypothetical protein